MACIVSLWEHTIALPNSTVVDRLRAPLPKKGVDKNEIQSCCKIVTAIQGLCILYCRTTNSQKPV